MKDQFLSRLVAGAPKVLETFNPSTGRFMTPGYDGPELGWAVTNQDVMYPLALLYKTRDPANPYAGDPRLLDVITKAGNAVRDWQNPDGQVEFIKIDGSKWGPTYMCWTQYHWLEAYRLIRDDLDAATRRRWEEGLTLAFDGSAKLISKDWRIHNIPTWHGMSLVRAGEVFGRSDWSDVGREMIRRTVAAQVPHGYWNEHGGPTTSYNLVYVHAIGLYHAFTRDDSVLDCLRRSLEFHMTFTYPDGCVVETIDGRVKYHHRVPDRCLPSYSVFPQGRRFVRFLAAQAARRGPGWGCTPGMASAFEHCCDGPESPIPQDQESYTRTMGEMARVRKTGKWFTCVSAILTEPAENRWGMDRQSFVSLYHDDVGLVIGGGNSKDQSAWSNFIVGDHHLPRSARLTPDGLELEYEPGTCSLTIEHDADRQAVIRMSLQAAAGQEAQCRLPVHILPGTVLTTGDNHTHTAEGRPIRIPGRTARYIAAQGWRVNLPPDAAFDYPVYPFNPYAKDGQAPLEEAAAFLHAPLTEDGQAQVFTIAPNPR